MSRSNDNSNVEQTVEPIADLKGKDGTWSWMTDAQRSATFRSSHKGITIDDVEHAWEMTHSRSGVAKLLNCSRPNAVRWLIKAGLIEPTEAQSAKLAPKGKQNQLQAELAAAKARIAELEAMSGTN